MTSLRTPIDFDTVDAFDLTEERLAEIMADPAYAAWRDAILADATAPDQPQGFTADDETPY